MSTSLRRVCAGLYLLVLGSATAAVAQQRDPYLTVVVPQEGVASALGGDVAGRPYNLSIGHNEILRENGRLLALTPLYWLLHARERPPVTECAS